METQNTNTFMQIENTTLQEGKKFDIYKEAVQNGKYITLTYDIEKEEKSKLREKLREI